MTDSPIAIATRRSIKKYFPMGGVMCQGNNNPITLHSVNDDLFARVWSVIAETMVVTGALSRPTKEAIATMVKSITMMIQRGSMRKLLMIRSIKK